MSLAELLYTKTGRALLRDWLDRSSLVADAKRLRKLLAKAEAEAPDVP